MIKSFSLVSKQISPYVNLHIKDTEQFKTNYLSFHFRRPLTPYEATHASLLIAIMTKCSKAYLTPTDFSKAMDALYGSAIYGDIEKYGEMLGVHFKIVFSKDAHLPEPILDQVLDFVKDIIFEPAFFEDDFDQNIFEVEKKVLFDEYTSRKNDRVNYSYDRLIEEMCKDENYSCYKYGETKVLEAMTLEDLKHYYTLFISQSELDIVAIGDFNEPAFKGKLEAFPFQMKRPILYTFKEKAVLPQMSRYLKELDSIQQGKLNMGYRLPVSICGRDYYGAVIMSFLLGNGVNSYLFRILREKENLCYYAFSRFEGYAGLMVIGSGIEPIHEKKAITVIEEGIAWIKSGAFKEEELHLAKKAVVKSLESSQDSLISSGAFLYSQLLRGNERGIEGYKDQVNSMTKEEVLQVANRLVLDTVYMLSSKEVE